jgi:hypothetical protein
VHLAGVGERVVDGGVEAAADAVRVVDRGLRGHPVGDGDKLGHPGHSLHVK